MINDFKKRIHSAWEKGGIDLLLCKFITVLKRELKNYFLNLYFRIIPMGQFYFQGRSYNYWRHTYNRSYNNERIIEVPIILEIFKKFKGKRILEIGNVLKNYFPQLSHDVLDKYEKKEGIINEDVADFKPIQKYDLIISISTFEHIGFDEEEKSSEKILQSVRNVINNCLSQGGIFVMAVPLGYNPYLDKFIKEKNLGFDHYYYLKRISADNRWIEISENDAIGAKFGEPFNNGNIEVICVFGSDIFKNK